MNRISGEVPPTKLKNGEPVYYDAGGPPPVRTYGKLEGVHKNQGVAQNPEDFKLAVSGGSQLALKRNGWKLKPGAPPDQEKENRQSRLPSSKACNAARQLWGELLKDYSEIRRIDHAVVQGWAARLEQLTTDLDEILHQIETGKQEGLKSWDD